VEADSKLGNLRDLGTISPGAVKSGAMALSVLGSAIIFAMMVLIISDIAGRFLFNRPISGVPEIVELAIVVVVFLQLPDALANGRLVRSDEIHKILSARRPKLGMSLALIFELLGGVLLALLAVGTFPIFYRAWSDNLFAGNPGVFTVPNWPVHLIIVFGSALTSAIFLSAAIRRIVEMHGKADRFKRP
jgi:TRAP-type C4-dicarboxylate transport system permease small subunit